MKINKRFAIIIFALCKMTYAGIVCPVASITAASPASGTVDARAPFDPSDGTTLLGIGDATDVMDTITITLDISDANAAALNCWSLCETAPLNGDNSITAVTQNGFDYTITLTRAITPGAVTAINYDGGLDVIYISSPGNVDANEIAALQDITILQNIQLGLDTAAHGLFSSDIDHNGFNEVADQTVLSDVLHGTGMFTKAWLNELLPVSDSDNDGTANCHDACPNDGNKIAAGICGCGNADTDTDSDGTADCNDACPNDAGKSTSTGQCGCGIADTDSDGDGTADCNDACPSDKNKTTGGVCGCGVADTNSDTDALLDCQDNCPNDANADQANCDGDGVGDACEVSAAERDNDGDGICNGIDVCPDDVTNACLAGNDDDNDGVHNNTDNCVNTPNPQQLDCNGDGIGDACEVSAAERDNDGDGLCNGIDVCPDDVTNACLAGNDDDNDGVHNNTDNCVNTPNPQQLDCDGDGVGDACEVSAAERDNDGDGLCNGIDACPDNPDVNCTPVGACCFGGGFCIDTLMEVDCVSIQGRFVGVGIPCNFDGDNDGFLACDDLCPNTPPGLQVDQNGCASFSACCFIVGVCIDDIDPANCLAISGTPQGIEALCGDGCTYPPASGDVNGDGAIDLSDFSDWELCAQGPSTQPNFIDCTDFDLDGNGFVDQVDFHLFQHRFTGPPMCFDDLDCDDLNACTDDFCDPTNGSCVHTDVVCAFDEFCGFDGVCTACTTCAINTDCPDDGLFCNGIEICGENFCCISSGDPCAAGTTCNEDLNRCDGTPDNAIFATLGIDNLIGTGGDDTFVAPLLFNAPTGTNVPSLQTGDSIAGGDGADIINAQFNFGVFSTVAPTVGDVETVNITDFGTSATTLVGVGITGATDFNFSNSTNTNVFTVRGLPSLANLGVMNQTVGATLVFATAASTGSTDSLDVTVNGLTGAGTVLTLATGTTNGFETLNIKSNTTANSFSDIAMNGTSLTTINVSGDANLTMTTSLDANVTTVSGTAATGGITLTQTNAGTFTFIGGAGDDSITLGGTYGTTDILDGGGGTNTLGGTTAVLGGTTSAQTNVTNFARLAVSNAHTTALNLAHFGLVTGVDLLVGSNGGSITNASTGFSLTCGARATNAVGTGTLAITTSGSGTTDSATYTLNDCNQNGAVTFTGTETLNLVSHVDLDGTAARGGANVLGAALILTDTAASEKVVVTGNEALTITGAVTANEIDASGFGQPLVMTAANTLTGTTVTGGTAADTLFGSAGNDIINGGDGNDTINPLAGNDIVSGGTGADIFRQSAGAANGVDRQTVSDFDDTVSTGDIFNLNTGLATLTGTNNFATSAAIQTHSTAGNLTVNAAAEVVIVTSTTVADLTSANSLNGTNLLTAIGGTITGAIVGQNDILICVADTSGNVGVYYATSANNAIIASEISLVAVLQGANVTLANLVFNNFTNGA